MDKLARISQEETLFALDVFSRSSSVLGTAVAVGGRLALRATCQTRLRNKMQPICQDL